ncbi:zinc finger protein 432-like [Anopheles aquasalis]|uniref:zinc finger protein 432-like n=1 Tax=Anopheles aquasalis TaxID=42839 RepID=UPI00215A3454|nr:zinc finger protein 432-like isoform X1 [Anopheles aquasalis]XP_050093397.1 zinc finger protein 432-like [Anopheles aquasalis]
MLTKYCRICLTSIAVVHQLDEVVHHSLTLYAILCKMYPEAFTENNDAQWPTRVCKNCKHCILEAYRLYTVCMASFEVFKKELQNELKTTPLRAKADVSVKRNCMSSNDEIDFKEAIITVDDEEDGEHLQSSDQEEGYKPINEKIIGKELDHLDDVSVKRNCMSSNDEIDFKEAIIKVDDEEDGEHLLSSDQEEGYNPINEKIIGKELDHLETLPLNEQPASPVVAQPPNTKRNKVVSESANFFKNEIVELQIEMDCVAQPSAVTVQEDHLDDFDKSIEYFDDAEDSLHVTAYQETVDNDERSTVATEVLDITMNSEAMTEYSNESEEDETFTETCSTELFSCNSCRDVFLDKASYEKHLKQHRLGRLICKMCNKGFKSVTVLNAHKCRYETSTLCWICGMTMATKKQHKKHMISHKPEEMWGCPLCPSRFTSLDAMKSHLVTHKKQKLFCCTVCGMNLSSKRNLKYHQQAVHGGGLEKVYNCNICDRRFAFPSTLKNHMNTHTGLRPYKCVYCNRVYGNGGDLVEHVAKHHVGNDNIYLCHLCDADFSKVRELKAHYEVHSRKGEKFYNEILTEFGKFRFTTMDLLKMRRRKETTTLSRDNANNQFPSSS